MATLKIEYATVDWTPLITFSIIPLLASIISMIKDKGQNYEFRATSHDERQTNSQ